MPKSESTTTNKPDAPKRDRHGDRSVPPLPEFDFDQLGDGTMLDEYETGAILRVARSTLGGWRRQQSAHPLRWFALPNGHVRYLVRDIRAFLAMSSRVSATNRGRRTSYTEVQAAKAQVETRGNSRRQDRDLARRRFGAPRCIEADTAHTDSNGVTMAELPRSQSSVITTRRGTASVTCRHCGRVFSAEASIEEILPFVATAEQRGWTLDDGRFWRCPECMQKAAQQADDYDAVDDFSRSIDEAYAAVRARVAAGGEAWKPRDPDDDDGSRHGSAGARGGSRGRGRLVLTEEINQ